MQERNPEFNSRETNSIETYKKWIQNVMSLQGVELESAVNQISRAISNSSMKPQDEQKAIWDLFQAADLLRKEK